MLNSSGIPRGTGWWIVLLTPKNLGRKTTKHASNIPHIQVVLCGFLEKCMFRQSSPDVFIVFQLFAVVKQRVVFFNIVSSSILEFTIRSLVDVLPEI